MEVEGTKAISPHDFLKRHIRKEDDAKSAFLGHLTTYNVIFVGEAHTTELHREKLAKWMNEIKAKGVKYIAVEWLANTPEVNEALKNQDEESIKAYLEKYWGKYDPNFASSALNLIKSAWANDITIVPLDVENAENQTTREEGWNKNLKPFIEECEKDQSKILIICGSAHADLESQAKILGEYNKKLNAGYMYFYGGSEFCMTGGNLIEKEAYKIESEDSTLKDPWIVFSGGEFAKSCGMPQAAWAQSNALTIIMPFIEPIQGGLEKGYSDLNYFNLNDIRPKKLK